MTLLLGILELIAHRGELKQSLAAPDPVNHSKLQPQNVLAIPLLQG